MKLEKSSQTHFTMKYCIIDFYICSLIISSPLPQNMHFIVKKKSATA